MQKPTLSLDTSIISAYWYDGRNAVALSRRIKTREWWKAERSYFAVFISSVTATELAAGDYRQKVRCVAMAKRLRKLHVTAEVERLGTEFIERGIVPKQKGADSLQLAVATIHRCDYLLTWNYAHLANPVVQLKLVQVCKEKKLNPPLLVSPETIPQARFGHTVRRRK